MIAIGKKAPGFTLKDQHDQDISLEDYKGQKVIVYFYPKDDTSGCTKEALGFTESLKKFESKNTIVLGVSKDSVKSHDKFCNKYDLKHTLLSDPECKMIDEYDAWQEKSMYGKTYMGIQRSTVLIDENGIVLKHWPKVKVPGHVDAVLESLN
ncbi:MAG: thioredoxin-dependent thiol peroxidase [Rickettsiales bacterium]|nr:thioredoxin-dependent thiol peroxidase [Rickettsiales bacterium]|tara:strand:- start:4290 stop:4745 length:456 start_codon:yes stop_codon:yes gene_type:complete